MDFTELMPLFRRLALEAGERILQIYGQPDFEVRSKGDASPVTEADEAADAVISAGLRAAYPDVTLITEEQAASHGLSASTFFIVDPLDGTKEFVQRRGDFTVNIALICGGKPVAGCVFAPARREMYFGGVEAHLIEAFAPGDALREGRRLKTRTYPAEGLTAITSSSHLDERTKAFLAARKVASQTGIGSSLKFCWVAAGKADVYPRWGPTMEWDTAAGHAVLQAAGGRMLTPEGGPFTYGNGAQGFRNGPFVAWGGEPV